MKIGPLFLLLKTDFVVPKKKKTDFGTFFLSFEQILELGLGLRSICIPIFSLTSTGKMELGLGLLPYYLAP